MEKGMDAHLFERCLVAYVADKGKELYGSHSDFARAIFPDAESSAATIWRSTRRCRQGGRLRSLTLEDCIRIAEALHIDLETLVWRVRKTLEDGWTAEQDTSALPDDEPRGRPNKNK